MISIQTADTGLQAWRGDSVPPLASAVYSRTGERTEMNSMPYVHWDQIGISEETKKHFALAMGSHLFRHAEMWSQRPVGSFEKAMWTQYTGVYDIHNDGVQSPIESIFVPWLGWMWVDLIGFPSLEYNFSIDGSFSPPTENQLIVCAQGEVDGLHVDFLLCLYMAGKVKRLAIEIDGHDFHEKTKEQAARDKKRDRRVTANDVRIVRFTGSEIFRNAEACADEVRDILNMMVGEVWN